MLNLLGGLHALHWYLLPSHARNKHPTMACYGQLQCTLHCIERLIHISGVIESWASKISRIIAASCPRSSYDHLICCHLGVSGIDYHLWGPCVRPLARTSPYGTWGHAWAHRPPFGDVGSVYTRGSRYFWGTWWHQMFHLTLTAPAVAVIDIYPIQPSGLTARTLALVIPFSVSGAIHASGSYSMWGDIKPMNTLPFFVLQPAGIAMEAFGSLALKRSGLDTKIPGPVVRMIRISFIVPFFLKTFPLLADDFARGGLFLAEPFPFSVLQVLGLGGEVRSHRLWRVSGIHWQTGQTWWQSGLTL